MATETLNHDLFIFATNDESYFPPEFSDDAFQRWALRITMKIVNLQPGQSDHAVYEAIASEGEVTPEWAQAYKFMAALSVERKGQALTA